ncbi:formate dehydrogenase subunit delta [Actibacterium sp. D379-3]
MSPEKLAHMANQIATAFATLPDDRAARAVASHINDFWDPRMRAQLLAMGQTGGAGLSPVVLQAAALIRSPAPASAP